MILHRVSRFLCVGVVAGLVVACENDVGGTATPSVPLAGLRYLNVVSDTGALDFRVVDIIGDAPGAFGATFRSGGAVGGALQASPPYQAVEAGTRRIRVFMSSSDPAIASLVVLDTTFTFAANTNYTFFLYGFARTGQTPRPTALITADDPPTPAAGQIAVRTIHLAPPASGVGNVDVFVTPEGTGALAGAPVLTNRAFLNVSTYTSMAVAPAPPSPTPGYRVAAAATGTTTPIVAQANAPRGVAGTTAVNPIGGTTIAGTVLTAVLVPRSVAGSQAPAGFTTPSLLYLIDRRPPSTAP